MKAVKSMTLIKKYLASHGYTLQPISLGQPPHSKFILITSPSGASITMSVSGLIYPFASSATKEIIDDKIKAYDFANLLGLTIPETVKYSDADNLDSVKQLLFKHKHLVVKPYNSFQSRGLTVNITTEAQLLAALEEAAQISRIVLAQQQVDGEEVRFIAIDGVIRAALIREKPNVIGDGTSTISQLIQKENELRLNITDSLVPYPVLDENILDVNLLNSDHILPAGQKMELNTKTMIRGGASVYNVIGSIDQSYITLAQNAAEKLGKGLIGVDLMIKDYTVPATSSNYTFIEFNSSISLPMCYSCRDGNHFAILEDYIGPMLKRAIN